MITTITATTLDALAAQMTPEVYEALDGIYSGLPTWGPETPRVRDLIQSSCASGDIVSWDTRAEDVQAHRYLLRKTDAGVSSFRVVTEAELADAE